MALDNETLAAAKSYTKKTVLGGGAVKGKNCTIDSIVDIEGGHRITFKWTLDDGTVQTLPMDVMDGVQGVKGEKGDRGAIGPSGAQGIQGVQGPAGPKGDTGAQGIQGIQGEQGIQGIQGPKGDDGYPFLIYKQYNDISEFDASDFPEIGLMFMVMTWETDPTTGDALGYPIYRFTNEGEPPYTLVTHMNTQGIQGPKGDKGDTGAQGPKGDTGEQGAKGDKGDKGDTGAQGIQGEQGIGLPDGGLTGQVLAKYSNQDYDFDWMSTTDAVRPDSDALVQSKAVYSAINHALSSIYTPRGELTCAELTSALLTDENEGNVYEMSDAGETTALFINGAGKTIKIGDNVGIVKAGPNTYLFNLMANAFDLTDYQKKDLASPVESQTTVEDALQALSANKASKDMVGHNLELYVNGSAYTTTTALLDKISTEIDAIKPTSSSKSFGGSIIGTWSGKSYFVGNYTVNSSGHGLCELKFENAQSGKDYCTFDPNSGTATSVVWEKLVTESNLNAVFRVYEYTSSNVPTKASFLTLLASSNAHMDFKFIEAVTDYMPNSSSYWYVQKFGGTDALHIRLLAMDWVSGDLYIGDANSGLNTITWWRLAGTQV